MKHQLHSLRFAVAWLLVVAAAICSATQVQASRRGFAIVFEKTLQDPAPADGVLVWQGVGYVGRTKVSVETRLAASDFDPNTGAITNFSFSIFDLDTGTLLHSAILAGSVSPDGRISMRGIAVGSPSSRVRLRARTRDGLLTVRGFATFRQ